VAAVTDSGTAPEALLRQARQFDRDGRIPEAIDAYQRLLQQRPDLANSWYNLGVLQRKNRQFSAALASYSHALDRGIARPEEVHLNRGVIYADHLRQDDAAERELLAALALNPAYVPALLNLANLREDRGQRELAAAAYDRALAIDACCFTALARRANLATFADRDDPLIARLRRAMVEPGASVADRADLGFALGRALDACADYAAAFDAYRAANNSSRESAGPGLARYDRQGFERLIDRLIAAFPAQPRGHPPRAEPSPGPSPEPSPGRPRPIFICGMFRSGSTLTEQILAGHPKVTAGGELDLLPHLVDGLAPFPASMAGLSPHHAEQLAARYLASLAQLFPAAEFVTDKRPDNFLLIGLIKSLFPQLKIVHTTRDPIDNCLSVFFLHLDHRMGYALDLLDTGHYYAQYRRLMDHWTTLFGDDLVEVPYDALVRDPLPVAKGLLSSLGLEWDERCLDIPATGRSIKTASVWQVREPLHARSSGRARHYADQTAPLRALLEI
jgi:tetratricopeptide (TPR) repeat protein